MHRSCLYVATEKIEKEGGRFLRRGAMPTFLSQHSRTFIRRICGTHLIYDVLGDFQTSFREVLGSRRQSHGRWQLSKQTIYVRF